MTEFLQYSWQFISALLGGGLLGFLFARRKNKAEALGFELENASKVVSLWRDLSAEQTERIKELEKQTETLKSSFKELEANYKEQCKQCSYRLQFEKA